MDISGPVIVKEHLVNRGIRSPGCRYAAGKIILPHSLKDAIVASGVQCAAFFPTTPEPAQHRVGVVANDILYIQYRQTVFFQRGPVGLAETVSGDADLFQLVEDVRVFGGWLKRLPNSSARRAPFENISSMTAL